MLVAVADRIGETLYQEQNLLFLNKHYNPAYPMLSWIEDQSIRARKAIDAESRATCSSARSLKPRRGTTKGCFYRTLPTPRFYSLPPGHSTSTVECLWGGMRPAGNNRSIFAAIRKTPEFLLRLPHTWPSAVIIAPTTITAREF